VNEILLGILAKQPACGDVILCLEFGNISESVEASFCLAFSLLLSFEQCKRK
jgi:hypothetical protein